MYYWHLGCHLSKRIYLQLFSRLLLWDDDVRNSFNLFVHHHALHKKLCEFLGRGPICALLYNKKNSVAHQSSCPCTVEAEMRIYKRSKKKRNRPRPWKRSRFFFLFFFVTFLVESVSFSIFLDRFLSRKRVFMFSLSCLLL